PGVNLQWQLACGAPGAQFLAGQAVHVYLPAQVRQRAEIVVFLRDHPGQAVATLHMAGAAEAQRHQAVVQAQLRDRAKQQAARLGECRHARYQHRCQAGTQQVGDAAIGGSEGEHLVGGGHQAPGEGHALDRVAVEQVVVGLALEYAAQLPGQVDCIADAGVHALAAGRAVHVRGVAEQEGALLAEMPGHAMVYAVHVQLAVHGRAAGIHVGHVEQLLVGAAGEVDMQAVAHGRMGAVAAGQ
uniref:ABC transporter ATP-binding protein n=1 Tax=Steinernema glaseri TaxID=37863 RepID=A0A1I7YAJ5_9BILA